MPGSCSDRRRAASAANAGFIFVLLQRVAHALGVGEGCAVTASYPEVRSDHHHANSFRTAPSLCADMIFGKDRLTGRAIERAYVDKGYRGHHTPNTRRVFMPGQKRGVFGRIKRELRRRSAIEAVIGHMKAEGHLGRCYLKGRAGDAANVILSAVGYK